MASSPPPPTASCAHASPHLEIGSDGFDGVLHAGLSAASGLVCRIWSEEATSSEDDPLPEFVLQLGSKDAGFSRGGARPEACDARRAPSARGMC